MHEFPVWNVHEAHGRSTGRPQCPVSYPDNNSASRLLTFALLSLRTVDPFALLAFALLASHWAPSIKNAEDSSSESRSAESSEITRNNRTAYESVPVETDPVLTKKKYGDAFENDFRARLGVLMKIHSRFIARPLNRFTHVESIQPGFQVLSNGHESIQRTRFNGFKFNRRRPLVSFALLSFALLSYKQSPLVVVRSRSRTSSHLEALH